MERGVFKGVVISTVTEGVKLILGGRRNDLPGSQGLILAGRDRGLQPVYVRLDFSEEVL